MLPSPDHHADLDAPTPAAPTLWVLPWTRPDDGSEIDPRSRYVEQFWLPVLGPSAVWLIRRLADALDEEPDGFDLDLDHIARSLGLGASTSRHAPIRRGIGRCVRFGLACRPDDRHLLVRRRLPPVDRRHLLRFPLDLQAQHRAYLEAGDHDQALRLRRRARLVALDLRELDLDGASIERHLLRRGVHPATAFEAARWAWSQAGVEDRPLVAEGQAVEAG